MLNLHLLRMFMAVAEHGSFSRAGEKLHISQPAVSKAVQELERQLHTTLLDRSGRTPTLTEAGALLLRHAQQLFAVERAAEYALEELASLERGHLAVGASSTIGIYLLPALMGTFHRRYPGVRLFLDIGNTQQITERLHTTPLDIAFVEGPVHTPDLAVEPWQNDVLVLIAAPDHPLTRHPAPAAADALAYPFLVREQGSGTREVVEAAMHERGLHREIAMELGSTEAIKQAVAAGLGLAVVSTATIAQERELGRLAVLHIPELTVQRTLTRLEVHGRPHSRALDAFLAVVAEAEQNP